MAEQLLDSPDVVTVLQQVGRERMPERMTRRPLGDTSRANSRCDRALDGRLMHMKSARRSPPRVTANATSWEHVLPGPIAAGVRILAGQSPRQRSRAEAGNIVTMLLTHYVEMCRESFCDSVGQRRDAVLASLPLSDSHLAAFELDVLHTEFEGLEQAQTGPIEQRDDQPGRAIQSADAVARLTGARRSVLLPVTSIDPFLRRWRHRLRLRASIAREAAP